MSIDAAVRWLAGVPIARTIQLPASIVTAENAE
jgi:hypothetical protein